jgi:N-acetylneuraminic acid mutarotase
LASTAEDVGSVGLATLIVSCSAGRRKETRVGLGKAGKSYYREDKQNKSKKKKESLLKKKKKNAGV